MKVVKEKRRKSLLRAREEGPKRGDFSFLYTSPSALPSTLFCHLTKRPKRRCPQRENYVGDFPKNVGLFPKKLPRFFCFSPTFFQLSRRKNDAPRYLMAKARTTIVSLKLQLRIYNPREYILFFGIISSSICACQ